MIKDNLVSLKRSEDLNYCFSYLAKSGASIMEHHERPKKYFSAFWFIMETGFTNSALEETFRQKATDFFERNLRKLNLPDYLIAFIPKDRLKNENERIFSCLLLASPAGRFFVFSDELLKRQEVRRQKIGMCEIYFFGNLLDVLKSEEAKKEFVKALLFSIKNSRSGR